MEDDKIEIVNVEKCPKTRCQIGFFSRLIELKMFWTTALTLSVLGLILTSRPEVLDKLLNNLDGLTNVMTVVAGYAIGKLGGNK